MIPAKLAMFRLDDLEPKSSGHAGEANTSFSRPAIHGGQLWTAVFDRAQNAPAGLTYIRVEPLPK